MHTRCTLPTRHEDDDDSYCLGGSTAPHNPCISTAGASAARSGKGEAAACSGITSPEAENALLPEGAYFVGLGFRAWLGDEQTPILWGGTAASSHERVRRSAAARLL